MQRHNTNTLPTILLTGSFIFSSIILEMLLSTINFNRCGRWQKIRLISNAIGCCNFGTIFTGIRPNCSNMLALKCCGCIHPTPSSYLQVSSFIYKPQKSPKNAKNIRNFERLYYSLCVSIISVVYV
jgi:hypothetical protein